MTLGYAAEPLVHIQDFRRDFGDTTVIRDLSFDVHAGESSGFWAVTGLGRPRRCGHCSIFTDLRRGSCMFAGRFSSPAMGHDWRTFRPSELAAR